MYDSIFFFFSPLKFAFFCFVFLFVVLRNLNKVFFVVVFQCVLGWLGGRGRHL